MNAWTTILVYGGLTLLGMVCNLAVSIAYFRWKQRESLPIDLTETKAKLTVQTIAIDAMHQRLDMLAADTVNLRVDMARIRGQLNFREWKKGKEGA